MTDTATQESQSWEPVEHTFASGRVATIRPHLRLAAMYRRAAAQGMSDIIDRLQEMERGELQDVQAAFPIQDLMIQTMIVKPEVLPVGAECKPGQITVDDLSDDEVLEVCALAMGGVAEAERFREELAGLGDGAGGAAVGSPAKQPRKRAAASRKRG